MRVLGLGWTQFATRWSSQSDTKIGTVEHLRKLLVDDILPEEMAMARLKKLPTEAAPPHHAAKELVQLGTADADALEIASKALFSAEELKIKAEAAVKRRETAGISDSVERMQPLDAPPFNQSLVGKRMEVSLFIYLFFIYYLTLSKPHSPGPNRSSRGIGLLTMLLCSGERH